MGARVESIGHDGARDAAVFVDKDFVEIKVKGGFSVGEGREEGVGLLVDLLEAVVGAVGSGKDGEQDNF